MKRSAYILSHFKISKTTYDLISQKTRLLTSEQRRFFLHVLCSHLIELQRGLHQEDLPGYDVRGIEIPFVVIENEFERGFSWERDGAALSPFLEASDYGPGHCRYFQVVPSLWDEIVTHLAEQVRAPDGSPAVNLFDGLAYNVAHAARGDGPLPSTKLMRDAMRILHATDCPINIAAIREHLVKLRTEDSSALQNDELCASTLFAGMKETGGTWSYVPSYAPQSAGRIGELGGGLQSCTKAMKQAAFAGIENLQNYDLRSCHGYIFLQELQLAGIDGSWVTSHLGPGVFEQRASELGLTKGIYKKCFFATVNGATHKWIEKGHTGALQAELQEYCDAPKQARDLFAKLTKELRPLKGLVEKWVQWLLNDSTCPHYKRSQRREVLHNAAGQVLVLDRSEDGTVRQEREAGAHVLQGQEAAYIHHLTLLSKRFGFTVISNQHDGLVTLGKVPEEAQAIAAKRSGFASPFLEEKPFW